MGRNYSIASKFKAKQSTKFENERKREKIGR
nr:hypothetical protein BSM_20470 [uncultured archaeon]